MRGARILSKADLGSNLSPLTSGSSLLVVRDDDIEFARLIGDWCVMAQMRMFGNMVMEAKEREISQFVPRRRSTKIREATIRRNRVGGEH